MRNHIDRLLRLGRRLAGVLASIDIVDDKTFVFKLKQPYSCSEKKVSPSRSGCGKNSASGMLALAITR